MYKNYFYFVEGMKSTIKDYKEKLGLITDETIKNKISKEIDRFSLLNN